MKKVMTIGILCMIVLGAILIAGCKKNDTVVVPTGSTGGDDGADSGDSGTADDGTTETPTNNDDAISGQQGEQTKIDLALTDVYWNSVYADPGNEVELTAKATNLGFEDAEGFSYQLQIKKDGVDWKTEEYTYEKTLGRGNTTNLKNTFTVPEGKYTAIVVLDNDKKIKEINELNNVMESKFELKAMIIAEPADDSSDDNSSED